MFSRRPPRKVLHWLPIFFAMTMLPGCERGGTGNDEGVRKPVSDSMPIASHLSPAAPRFTYVVDAGNDTIAVRKIDQDPRHPGGGQAPKASQSVSIHPSGR